MDDLGGALMDIEEEVKLAQGINGAFIDTSTNTIVLHIDNGTSSTIINNLTDKLVKHFKLNIVHAALITTLDGLGEEYGEGIYIRV